MNDLVEGFICGMLTMWSITVLLVFIHWRRSHSRKSPRHEAEPGEYIPVCDVCWGPVYQDDDEQWQHSRDDAS